MSRSAPLQGQDRAGRAGRVGVILPALDEELALPLVLADLSRQDVDAVVVVDNGSRDRTAAVARQAGAHVVSEPRRGYGSACLAGIACLQHGLAGVFDAWGEHDWVVFLDADHSDDPADLPILLAPLREGRADFVLGSRVLGGASMRALLPQAWLGNRLACFLMRWLFGAQYTDLGPFRALGFEALKSLRVGDRGFGWTVEMQLKAHRAGLRTLEVPVRYRPRAAGRSKVTGTLRGTLGAATKILGWIVGYRFTAWRRPRESPSDPKREPNALR